MLRPFDRIGPRSRFQVHAAPRLISSSRFRSPYQLSTFRVITRVILDWTVTGQINIFKRSIRAIYVCTHVYIYIHVYTRKGTARTRENLCAILPFVRSSVGRGEAKRLPVSRSRAHGDNGNTRHRALSVACRPVM